MTEFKKLFFLIFLNSTFVGAQSNSIIIENSGFTESQGLEMAFEFYCSDSTTVNNGNKSCYSNYGNEIPYILRRNSYKILEDLLLNDSLLKTIVIDVKNEDIFNSKSISSKYLMNSFVISIYDNSCGLLYQYILNGPKNNIKFLDILRKKFADTQENKEIYDMIIIMNSLSY